MLIFFIFLQFLEKITRGRTVVVMPRKKGVGDGDSAAQNLTHGSLPDGVRTTKKSSTPVASGTTGEKGASDKDKATTNRNLAQGKEIDAVRTVTSYFDPVWNSFSNHTHGSMQWIPKQIVAIGEDFHNQVGDGKVRTTLYKVCVIYFHSKVFMVQATRLWNLI
jgi:hypothetical protein